MAPAPPPRCDAIFLAAVALAAAVTACQASTGATSACRAVCGAAAAAPPSMTTLSCSDHPGLDSPVETATAVSVSLNWTLDKDLGQGRLSIEASLPQGGARQRLLLLALKTSQQAPCPPLRWGRANSLQIFYGQSWPPLELLVASDETGAAAPATTTSRLEVHGGVQLHSLLQTLPGLVELYASEVALESRPIGGLAHLRTLVLAAESTRTKPVAAERVRLLDSLPALQSAKFFGSRIASLHSGFIAGVPSLRYLYLIKCSITDIAADAFDSLSAGDLRHLFLEGNQLDALPSRLFRQLPALSQLRLPSNGLRQIAADTFAGLARLELLDLSGNHLRWLPGDAFVGLGRLRALNLRDNPLLGATDGASRPSGLLFCPLASLVTLHADSPVDCREFASHHRVNVLVAESRSRRRVVHCDLRPQQQAQLLDGSSWCGASSGSGGELVQPRLRQQQQQQGQEQFNLPLLLIFGAICAAHLVTALVTVALCRRVVASRRRSPTQTPSPAAYAVDDDDDNEGGVGGALIRQESDPASAAAAAAAPVLVSFQSRSSTAAVAVRQLEIDACDDVFPREKTRYEFDEDV